MPLQLPVFSNTSHLSLRCNNIFFAFSALMFFGGCEDLLPEYHPPTNIFSASVEYVEAVQDTVEFSEPRDGSGGAVATYAPFFIVCSITNTYEETFQDIITPSGTLEILLPGNNSIKSTSLVSPTDIIPSSHYNDLTGVLTLDPRQKLYFRIKAEPKLSSGFYLHKYATESNVTIFASRYYILKTYQPLTLLARFSVQLSQQLPAITTEEKPFSVNLKGRFPFSP